MVMVDDAQREMRLDRWLWASRFFKTRPLAVAAIKGGHVAVNGGRAKPAKTIRIGDVLRIRRGQETYTVTVTGLAAKRLAATLAAELYTESDASRAKREQLRAQSRAEAEAVRYERGRPSKRHRRVLGRMKRDSLG